MSGAGPAARPSRPRLRLHLSVEEARALAAVLPLLGWPPPLGLEPGEDATAAPDDAWARLVRCGAVGVGRDGARLSPGVADALAVLALPQVALLLRAGLDDGRRWTVVAAVAHDLGAAAQRGPDGVRLVVGPPSVAVEEALAGVPAVPGPSPAPAPTPSLAPGEEVRGAEALAAARAWTAAWDRDLPVGLPAVVGLPSASAWARVELLRPGGGGPLAVEHRVGTPGCWWRVVDLAATGPPSWGLRPTTADELRRTLVAVVADGLARAGRAA